MVSVLASMAVDRGFESLLVKPKTIKLVFVASPVNTQHWGERANAGWVGIRIMCLNVTTCLSSIVISVSWHYKHSTKRVALAQNRSHHHHFIEN